MTDTARLTTKADATVFMTGGNAYFTLVSKKTSTRYTYRVSTKPDAPYFVGVLSGPENDADYQYLGFMRSTGSEFKLVAGRKGHPEAQSFQAFAWFLASLGRPGTELPEQLEFWHAGRCGRCGRRLTVPASIASGFGPECAGRV